jgi:hypothetical protein
MYGPTSEAGNVECSSEAFGTEEVLDRATCGGAPMVDESPATLLVERAQERVGRKVVSVRILVPMALVPGL